jgi:lysophospholipase L1-like esterase
MRHLGLLFSGIILAAGGRAAAAPATPPSPYTVVIFGDSTSAPRTDVDIYPRQLERSFRASVPPVAIINAAVPSDTTERARKRFARDVLARHPDLVVIQLGINDSAIDVWKKPLPTEHRVSLARYEENLRYFIAAIEATGARVILMTPNQLRWTPYLRTLYGRAPYRPDEERGFTLVLDAYVAAMRRVAADTRVPLVDIYAAYDAWAAEHKQNCQQLLLDGMHPNSLGHALVLAKLRPLIVQALPGK